MLNFASIAATETLSVYASKTQLIHSQRSRHVSMGKLSRRQDPIGLLSTCMISIFCANFLVKCASSALSICQTQICQEKKKEKLASKLRQASWGSTTFCSKENSGAARHNPALGVYLFKTLEGLFLWAVEGESERCQLISVTYLFFFIFILVVGCWSKTSRTATCIPQNCLPFIQV